LQLFHQKIAHQSGVFQQVLLFYDIQYREGGCTSKVIAAEGCT
jgi:hypothetical protein